MDTRDCIKAIRYDLTKIRKLDKLEYWNLPERRQAAEAIRQMEKNLQILRYCCGLA